MTKTINNQNVGENTKIKSQYKNLKFDNKLKNKGLIDFVRKEDYVNGDTEIKLFHIGCQKSFSVKPNLFFKRKHKCLYCHKKESKNKMRSTPKNDFYQEKLNILTNNEFELMSNYYRLNTYVELKHLVCGKTFETRPDNFEKAKNKCPHCSDRNNIFNRTTSEKIQDIEKMLGNQYKVLSKIICSDGNIALEHKACGNKFECTVSSIHKFKNKQRIRIKCPKCYLESRREEFLDRLSRIQGDEFKLRGAYRG